MSRNSDKILILHINPSKALSGILLGLHAGATAIVLVLPISAVWRLTLLALVGASLYHTVWVHALRQGRQAVQSLELETDGEWRLYLRDAGVRGPCRAQAYYLHPWFVILQLRCAGRWLPINLVLAADAVDAQALRELRVRLNTEGLTR